MALLITTVRRGKEAAEEEQGTRRGYWLVRESDSRRFFISDHVSTRALDRVCNATLSEAMGWGYWIDYCLGLDVDGRPAWTNVDLTDHFI